MSGANPTDRGRAGIKRHLVVDRRGIPLAVLLSGANVHDSQRCIQVLDAIPGLRTAGCGRGRPRKCPHKHYADKAYDSHALRVACWRRSIYPRFARRSIESSERLGKHRWVMERSFAWLNRFRRLAVRYERSADLISPSSCLAVPSFASASCLP
jgi:transposase